MLPQDLRKLSLLRLAGSAWTRNAPAVPIAVVATDNFGYNARFDRVFVSWSSFPFRDGLGERVVVPSLAALRSRRRARGKSALHDYEVNIIGKGI